MTDDTYNGWANKETWALNLWLSNDEGLYRETLEVAREHVDHTVTDHELGGVIVSYWHDKANGYIGGREPLRMMDREVGSWWRVDYDEIGASVREMLE